jgi:hypothetical protein
VAALARAHLDAAGVEFADAHELACGARAFFAGALDAAVAAGAKRSSGAAPSSSAAATSLTHEEFTAALRHVLSRDDAGVPPMTLPPWALRVFEAQFALACGERGDGGGGGAGMRKLAFVAWRARVQRCTPAQLSRATRADGWGEHAPSLEEVFAAADGGRTGRVTAGDWARLVTRFWACAEPWDELNAYSL